MARRAPVHPGASELPFLHLHPALGARKRFHDLTVLPTVLNAGVTRPRTGHDYLDRPSGPIPFAHRGGALHPELEGLENTLHAFRHAYRLGYRHLETDVHCTRDGVLLAFHDRRLDRVTDRTGNVCDLSYDEVRLALIGTREPIPTLGELFDEFPHACFNIDIKAPDAVEPLARFLRERRVEDRVLVGSFSPESLNRFRAITLGRVLTSAHPLEVLIWVLSPSGRLADWLTGRRVAALQVPHHRRIPGLGWRLPVVTRRLVRKAHAAGRHVHVWTVDDPVEIRELLALGVDGLMTDRTDMLKDVLISMGVWEGEPHEPRT